MNPRVMIVAMTLFLARAPIPSTAAAPANPSARTQTQAAIGTAFTYQGRLTAIGNPINGACDAQFTLWDAAAGGMQIGGPLVQSIMVGGGLFTTSIDFGAGAFDGSARWLAISIRCPSGSGSYTSLSPRQPLAPAPYALHAAAPWTTTDTTITYNSGNVGINLSALPGERLHVGDGNILLEGGDETALKVKRDFTTAGDPSEGRPPSTNPIFELGRVIEAGDGDPEFRVLYRDDAVPPNQAFSVFEFDRKGVVASVKPKRGSHFEGFVRDPNPFPSQPVFRLNSFPKMRLEMGEGDSSLVDVAIQREAADTLTLHTGSVERMRIDPIGNVGVGTATPESRLQIAGGYIQLPTITGGAPPAPDCASPAHYGRAIVRTDGSTSLYVCTASGWIGH